MRFKTNCWTLRLLTAVLVAAMASAAAQAVCGDAVYVFDAKAYGAAPDQIATPAGCTEMLVKIWGGGGGLPGGLPTPQTGNSGGGGAVIARIPISPAGETFVVRVPVNTVNTNVPGMAAWIHPVGADPELGAIALAGGGGVGGRGTNSSVWEVVELSRGGAGGGQSAMRICTRNVFTGELRCVTGGTAATPNAPGIGGTNRTPVADGLPFDQRLVHVGSGGPGSSAAAGWGGDGWFGGGGGGFDGAVGIGAGGGGGANFVVATYGGLPVQSQRFMGSGRLPGNAGDPDRLLGVTCSPEPCGPGVGRAGAVGPYSAVGGRVVIRFGSTYPFPPPPVSDFDGDGATDLVWQNQAPAASTWPVRFWLMSGTTRKAEVTLAAQPPAGLRLAAVGDFGSCVVGVVDPAPDGHPDLVFRAADNVTPNETWYLVGTTLVSASCKVKHQKPDGSPFIAGGSWADPSVGLVAGAADLGSFLAEGVYSPERDGRPDLVWQNLISLNLVHHEMAGVTKWAGDFFDPPTVSGGGWLIVGLADLGSTAGALPLDGTLDLLWENPTSHRVSVWYMGADGLPAKRATGNFLNSGGPLPTSGFFQTPDGSDPLDWHLVAVGDVNGDGNADAVFRSTEGANATGKLHVWFLAGADRLDQGSSFEPTAEPNLDWKLIAPR